jgi:hypothetical protein
MLEMGRRAQGDGLPWRRDTATLASEAARQAAYCLDAPDDIPAGGMYSDEMDGLKLSMPMVADREPDTHQG